MAKRKQPETSMEALDEKSSESRNRDYDRIMNALKYLGSGNYDDIAKFLQVEDANIVSRRLKEMREMSLIVNTGEKTMTRRNRRAFVHCLSNLTQPKTDDEKKQANAISDISANQNSKPKYIQSELL